MKKRAVAQSDRSVKLIRRGKTPVAVELTIDAYEDLLEQADSSYRSSLQKGRAEYESRQTVSFDELKQQLGL